MSRSRLCRVCKDFHNTAEAWPWACRGHFPPPPHGTLNVISDNLDYTMNPADGKRYTSKAKYYAAVRAKGCEIVGNDKSPPRPKAEMPDPTQDIVNAMRQHGAL